MKRTTLFGEDAKQDSFAEHVLQNAIGPIEILDSAPSTSNKNVQRGQIARHDTTLYIESGGTVYSLALTSVYSL